MTDFIAKARHGRTIALNLRQSGSVMFFPEELEDSAVSDRGVRTEMSKPMFVRSSSIRSGAIIATPRADEVANSPLVLTEDDLAVENVIRLAA